MKAGRKLAVALQRLRIRRMSGSAKALIYRIPTPAKWPPHLRIVASNDLRDKR